MSDGWVTIPPGLDFLLDRISVCEDCKQVTGMNTHRGPFIDLLKPRNISPKGNKNNRFDPLD